MHKNKINTQFGELSRRFIQTSATVAGVVAVAGSITFLCCSSKTPAIMPDEVSEKISYSACLVNCGSRCPLKVHVKDGVISRIQ